MKKGLDPLRLAGIISSVMVFIAIILGIYSLNDHFGLSAGGIVAIMAPVALGVVLLTAGLIVFGFWTVRKLNQADESTPSSDARQHRRS